MGRADYYKSGDWNGICQTCGKKYKYSQLKTQWDGIIACPKCFDYRHPQEFVRAIPDNQSVPDSSPEPTDTFI